MAFNCETHHNMKNSCASFLISFHQCKIISTDLIIMSSPYFYMYLITRLRPMAIGSVWENETRKKAHWLWDQFISFALYHLLSNPVLTGRKQIITTAALCITTVHKYMHTLISSSCKRMKASFILLNFIFLGYCGYRCQYPWNEKI